MKQSTLKLSLLAALAWGIHTATPAQEKVTSPVQAIDFVAACSEGIDLKPDASPLTARSRGTAIGYCVGVSDGVLETLSLSQWNMHRLKSPEYAQCFRDLALAERGLPWLNRMMKIAANSPAEIKQMTSGKFLAIHTELTMVRLCNEKAGF